MLTNQLAAKRRGRETRKYLGASRLRLFKEHGGCQACGWSAPTNLGPVAMNVHHIVPVKHGGGDDADNLILLCANCHAIAHWIDSHNASEARTKSGIVRRICDIQGIAVRSRRGFDESKLPAFFRTGYKVSSYTSADTASKRNSGTRR